MGERAGLILLIPFLAVYFKGMAYIYVIIFLVFTITLLYGQFGERIGREIVILGGSFIAGGCALLLGGGKSFLILSLTIGIIGFVASPIVTAAYTLIQEMTPDRIRGRVFSALEVVINVSFLLFICLGGILAAKFPIENIFYFTGVGLLVYAGGFLLLRFFKGRV